MQIDGMCNHKCKVELRLKTHYFTNISENLSIIWVIDQIFLNLAFCIWGFYKHKTFTNTPHTQCLSMLVYAESIIALIDVMPKIEIFACFTQYISSFAE